MLRDMPHLRVLDGIARLAMIGIRPPFPLSFLLGLAISADVDRCAVLVGCQIVHAGIVRDTVGLTSATF